MDRYSSNFLIQIQKVRSEKIERTKRKKKKHKLQQKKDEIEEYDQNRIYREMAKNINRYDEVINVFMPKNLKYLISYNKSILYLKKSNPSKCKPIKIVPLPVDFSILKNPKETYKAINEIVETLVCQQCKELWIDYDRCKTFDLLTQVFLDSILKDWDKFVKSCVRANLSDYIKVHTIGGKNYKDTLQRMVNSVGSPTILINRRFKYDEIIPYNLRFFDLEAGTQDKLWANNEADITSLLEYVNKCLNKINKTLTAEAVSALGTVIGEILINASEHSTLKSRYVIGYFEDLTDENMSHHGILNLVILNYGQSIYERFKYPLAQSHVNQVAVSQMMELSNLYVKRGFFGTEKFKESTLWTLYALQQGVTIIPDANRGNGTIQFIDKFFALREADINNESRMYLLSGNTIIEFDGSYGLFEIQDENGNKRSIMSFNKEGNLREKPDSKYVRFTDYFFPGTALFARIVLNAEITKDESN